MDDRLVDDAHGGERVGEALLEVPTLGGLVARRVDPALEERGAAQAGGVIDDLHQHPRLDRLDQVEQRAEINRLLGDAIGGRAGDEDDRHPAAVAPRLAQQVEPRQPGHLHVGDDRVEALAPEHVVGLDPVGRGADLVALHREHARVRPRQRELVVGHQHAPLGDARVSRRVRCFQEHGAFSEGAPRERRGGVRGERTRGESAESIST